MLHDDFFAWFKKKHQGRPELFFHDEVMDDSFFKDVVPFYFGKVTISPELSSSYEDFCEAQDKKLISPYDYVMIIIENGGSWEDDTFYAESAGDMQCTHQIVIGVLNHDHHLIALNRYLAATGGLFLQVTNDSFMQHSPDHNPEIKAMLDSRNEDQAKIAQYYSLSKPWVDGTAQRVMHYAPDEAVRTEFEITQNIFCQCVMMINLPHYEKAVNKVPEKVIRKREKKGRASAPQYIKVQLRREVSEALRSMEGAPKAPHWRRGHIRRLSPEKTTWVKPCMVNWDGEPLDFKSYGVEVS